MPGTKQISGHTPVTINMISGPDSETRTEKIKMRAGESPVLGGISFTLSKSGHRHNLTYDYGDRVDSVRNTPCGHETVVALRTDSPEGRKRTIIEFNPKTRKLRVTQMIDKLLSNDAGGSKAAPTAGPRGAGRAQRAGARVRAFGAPPKAPTPPAAALPAAQKAGVDAAVRFTDAVIAAHGNRGLENPVNSQKLEVFALSLRQNVEEEVGKLMTTAGGAGKVEAAVTALVAKSIGNFGAFMDPVGRQAKLIANSSAKELETRLREVAKDNPDAASHIDGIVEKHRRKTEDVTRALLSSGNSVAFAWKKADKSAEDLRARFATIFPKTVRRTENSSATPEAREAAKKFVDALANRHGTALDNPVVARRVMFFREFLEQDIEKIVRPGAGGAPDEAAKAKAVENRINQQLRSFEAFFERVDVSADPIDRQARSIAANSAFELERSLLDKFGDRAKVSEIQSAVSEHYKAVREKAIPLLQANANTTGAAMDAARQREEVLNHFGASFRAHEPRSASASDSSDAARLAVEKRKKLANIAAHAAAEKLKKHLLAELNDGDFLGLDHFDSAVEGSQATAAFEAKVAGQVENFLALLDPKSLQTPMMRRAALSAGMAFASADSAG